MMFLKGSVHSIENWKIHNGEGCKKQNLKNKSLISNNKRKVEPDFKKWQVYTSKRSVQLNNFKSILLPKVNVSWCQEMVEKTLGVECKLIQLFRENSDNS